MKYILLFIVSNLAMLECDKVRQLGEISKDNGQTWPPSMILNIEEKNKLI